VRASNRPDRTAGRCPEQGTGQLVVDNGTYPPSVASSPADAVAAESGGSVLEAVADVRTLSQQGFLSGCPREPRSAVY